MGKTAVPAENACSSALNAAPAWEVRSSFAVAGCFSGDKGESQAKKSATWGDQRERTADKQ